MTDKRYYNTALDCIRDRFKNERFTHFAVMAWAVNREQVHQWAEEFQDLKLCGFIIVTPHIVTDNTNGNGPVIGCSYKLAETEKGES
jgi:hypothetical protein